MSQWTVDAPMRLAFDDVTALRVRAIAGSVAILATSETPALDITRISGQPLTVTHEDGVLTISYEDLTWDGLLEWLRPRNHSAEMTVTVPRDCPAQVGVIAATAVVSGVAARTSVKSVSGAITLDGLNGTVDARTVGADVEAQDINGAVTFNSVSGDLTLAGGSLDRLDARTVTGSVTADVHLGKPGNVRVATVSSDVALRLPAQPDARVSLRSTSGRVLSEFGCLRSSHAPASHSVNGTLGAGTGHISVTTLSGRVTLLRRAAAAAGAGRPGAAPGRPPAIRPRAARGHRRPAAATPGTARYIGAEHDGRGKVPQPGQGSMGDGHRSGAHGQRGGAGRRTDEGRGSMSPVFRHGRLRLYLLRLLDEEPRHGYEVIRMLRDQFMGVYAPSPGTIYPRLARLEEEGLVTHDDVDGRKVYRITEAGRQELHEREDELAELEQELSDSVRDIVREVKEDVRETVRSLREELTWAARTARRPDEQDGEDGPARPGTEPPVTRSARRARRRRPGSGPAGPARKPESRPGGCVRTRRRTPGGCARTRRSGPGRNATRPGPPDATGTGATGRPGPTGPGRRGWPGRPDAGLLRDLEQTVKGFARDLGRLAWQSGAAAGEDALTELRIILDETLERVRSEIFETTGPHGQGHDDPRPPRRWQAGTGPQGSAAGTSAQAGPAWDEHSSRNGRGRAARSAGRRRTPAGHRERVHGALAPRVPEAKVGDSGCGGGERLTTKRSGSRAAAQVQRGQRKCVPAGGADATADLPEPAAQPVPS